MRLGKVDRGPGCQLGKDLYKRKNRTTNRGRTPNKACRSPRPDCLSLDLKQAGAINASISA